MTISIRDVEGVLQARSLTNPSLEVLNPNDQSYRALLLQPVILIDDPITHIDDLNALSFLDYLRDLTVNSNRQIFFATADTRIAALFARKFGFLGDAFKTISLTRELT